MKISGAMRIWIVCAGGWAILLIAALLQRAAARPGTIVWDDALQRVFWMWAVPALGALLIGWAVSWIGSGFRQDRKKESL